MSLAMGCIGSFFVAQDVIRMAAKVSGRRKRINLRLSRTLFIPAWDLICNPGRRRNIGRGSGNELDFEKRFVSICRSGFVARATTGGQPREPTGGPASESR